MLGVLPTNPIGSKSLTMSKLTLLNAHADGLRDPVRQQGIAVGRRTRDGFGGEVAGGAGPVLDDERLAQAFLELLAVDAGDDVERAAGGKPADDLDRPRGIGALRPRGGGSRERARGQHEQRKQSSHGRFLGWTIPVKTSARRFPRRHARFSPAETPP
jgi:hypothetical protein